ncbi:FHA domain-containing protein [Butyrivibrio sp. XB500-5]|uniref:FHA domain-containing protein n=1 Tax=Butyrivibrio sp. XB500-5 TaxID=2364880 RepID=UPI000EA8A163|nr:FHA domain-containing protein [Butyrivibrio sp. XB500-5]RKM63162.1 FHA domain-containing protein [Butyrivibrio sp. XB500-5]
METLNSQTHISFKPDDGEKISGFGMKMLKQMNNENILDIAQVDLDGRETIVCRTEGLDLVETVKEHLTVSEKINLLVGLSELINAFDENPFLNKEFIVLDADKIYLSPEDGHPKFVILPMVLNSTGSLGREWLEKLYKLLKDIVLIGDIGADRDLAELKKKVEAISGNKEFSTNELFDLSRFISSTFKAFRYDQSENTNKRSGNIEVKLTYDGEYGKFALFIVKNGFVIGNADSCDGKILCNKAISRQHGEIYLEGGECFYEDLGSSNHSGLNGHILQAGEKVKIQNGDVLRLADMDLMVEIEERVG